DGTLDFGRIASSGYHTKNISEGDNIDVVIHRTFSNPERISLYREYYECQNGAIIDLKFVKDFSSGSSARRFLTDDSGIKLNLGRFSWQRGKFYNPPLEGSVLKYKVELTENGRQLFSELNTTNPYFSPVEELKLSKKEKSYILHLLDSNIEFDDIPVKLSDQYADFNANWLITLIRYLRRIAESFFDRQAYTECVFVSKLQSKVIFIIQHHPFLTLYQPDKRSEVSRAMEKTQAYNDNRIRRCGILDEGDVTFNIRSLVSDIISLDPLSDENSLFNKLSDLAWLMQKHEEKILRSQIEAVIEHIVVNNKYFASSFSRMLTDKRKELRSKLFNELSFGNATALIGDKRLAYLIVLQEFQVKKNEYYQDTHGTILDLATYYQYRMHYAVDDLEVKIHARNCLESFRIDPDHAAAGYSLDRLKSWKHSRSIIIAQCLEFLAYREVDEVSIKEYLVVAMNLYRGHSRRYYFLKELLSFYKLQDLIREGDLETIIDESQRCKDALQETSEEWETKFPILKSMLDIYIIMSSIFDFDDRTFEYLHKRSQQELQFNLPLPDRKGLAGLVLANNLLSFISNDDVGMFDLIRTFFLKGSVSINKFLGSQLETAELSAEFLEIIGEETSRLEVKGSVMLDLNVYFTSGTVTYPENVWMSFLKTIAGFLNTSGGTLIVGALEVKKYEKDELLMAKITSGSNLIHKEYILNGVDIELKSLKKDLDTHWRMIGDKIAKYIKADLTSFIEMKHYEYMKKTFYVFHINPHPNREGVFVQTPKKNGVSEQIFYVRDNNRTKKLSGLQLAQFIANKA
ncbi:MAG: hypothetical protein HOG34_21115, partial [Bacteroidetes bacterium]|nr:hypothetical protein [Bacteroidota bacterium]